MLTGFLTYGIYHWHNMIVRVQAQRYDDPVFHAPLADWMKFVLYQIGGLAFGALA